MLSKSISKNKNSEEINKYKIMKPYKIHCIGHGYKYIEIIHYRLIHYFKIYQRISVLQLREINFGEGAFMLA